MNKFEINGPLPTRFASQDPLDAIRSKVVKPTPKPKSYENLALRKKVHDAAQKFEAIFLKEMLKVATPKESERLFGGGLAGDFFQDFQLDEQSQDMAKTGGFGLAEILEKEIMALEDKKFKPEIKTDDKLESKVNQLRARKSYP